MLIVLLALIACSCAAGDNPLDAHEEMKKTGKIDSALIELHEQFRHYSENTRESGQFKATDPRLRIVDEYVLIDAIALDSAAALEESLRSLGAKNLSSHGHIVSCYFPIRRITKLAVVDSLRFVRPAYAVTRPVSHQVSVK